MSRESNIFVGVVPITVVFVVLKLTHVINWSWWWVLSPLWIGVGIAILAIIVTLIVVALVEKKV